MVFQATLSIASDANFAFVQSSYLFSMDTVVSDNCLWLGYMAGLLEHM